MFDDLAEARSLIESGKYEPGLDHLTEATRVAVAQRKFAELREIVALAGIVSEQSTGRTRKRSEKLVTRAARQLSTPSAGGADVTPVLPGAAPAAPAEAKIVTRDPLWVPLAVQAAFLPLYGFWALLGAGSSPSSPAWISFVLMGGIWLLVAALLVYWWQQGRQGLIGRAVTWGALAWLNILLLLLLPWQRTRRLLVPPPPD